MIKEEQNFVVEFDKLVDGSAKIAIIGHLKPDFDCIASAIGVKWYVDNVITCPPAGVENKQADIIIEGGVSADLRKLPYFNQIKFVEDLKNVIDDYDLLVFVDNSTFDQFAYDYEFVDKVEKKKVIIDHHHLKSASNADLRYLAVSGSCTELVYKLLLGNEELPSELYTLLFLGIFNDTGSFAFIKPAKVESLIITAEIIEKGKIDVKDTLSKYMSYSKETFEVIQELVKNQYFSTTEGFPGFMISYIDNEFIKSHPSFSIEFISTARRIYFGLFYGNIESYPIAIGFYPMPDGGWNMSLRSSDPEFNVGGILEEMGIGGGHPGAGSGVFKPKQGEVLSREECFNKLVEFLKAKPKQL